MSDSTSFLFPNRLARLPFFGRYIILLIAAVMAGVLLELGGNVFGSSLGLSGPVRLWLNAASFILLISILVCLFRSILFPRLRDIGLHSAYSLIIFVPFINFLFLIALLFVPTDAFTKPTGIAQPPVE
jgi:uncharacterized membrane protein YhaH (DUF805 family)